MFKLDDVLRAPLRPHGVLKTQPRRHPWAFLVWAKLGCRYGEHDRTSQEQLKPERTQSLKEIDDGSRTRGEDCL